MTLVVHAPATTTLTAGSSALDHRNRAVRRGRLLAVAVLVLAVSVARRGLDVGELWPVLVAVAAQSGLVAASWRAALRERDRERLVGMPSWPSALDLARL